GRVVGTEGGGEGLVEGGRAGRGDPGGGLRWRPDQQAAAVDRVGGRLDGARLVQPGDAGGHLALREAGPLGDLADRAAGVVAYVAGDDEHRPVAGGVATDALGRDGLLADLHQRPAEQEQLDAVHVAHDTSGQIHRT